VPSHRPKDAWGCAAAKITFDEILASRDRMNRTSMDFLRIDLDTALTFSSVALQTDDMSKKHRNQRAARRAYDTVLRLIKKVTLTDAEARVFAQSLGRLKSDLENLGEIL